MHIIDPILVVSALKFENLEAWNCLHKTFNGVTWSFKQWYDLRANFQYGLKHFVLWASPWPSYATKCNAHYRPDFRMSALKFRKYRSLELFAQDVRAMTWHFKQWCDLRANLQYGLKHFVLWARPWPSCATKFNTHYRPDFGRVGLEIPKTLKLWIVCSRRSRKYLEF